MPPARQRRAPPATNSSATASRTRVGICSDSAKYHAPRLEVAAVQRNQALIAVGVGALVDGHGQMAFAEQRPGVGLARRARLRNARSIEARVGAHPVGGVEVDDQHADRPVALRLQNQAAFDLDDRAQHDGEDDRLTKQLGDGRRIIVAGQDVVDQRAQPNDTATQIERGHLEGRSRCRRR